MINYENVGKAIAFYRQKGFLYIEAPWTVSSRAIHATLPSGIEPTRIQNGGILVGSAEQSFIQLGLDGQLRGLGGVAATPCFRDEKEDALHKKYFFKVELFMQYHVSLDPKIAQNMTLFVAKTALEFFRSLPGGEESEIVETPSGLDIQLNGIELGSYGYREYVDRGDALYWTYGTGYADPRFTFVTLS